MCPPARIVYTNWRGETAIREVIPGRVYFSRTDYHPEPQWLMDAHDVEKDAERTFALRDVKAWL